MIYNHLFQPRHSTSTKHIVFDVLLKTVSKNYVSSPGRKSASRFRLPAMRKIERCLEGLGCIFAFFHECLCKFWTIITKYKWNTNPVSLKKSRRVRLRVFAAAALYLGLRQPALWTSGPWYSGSVWMGRRFGLWATWLTSFFSFLY